MSSRLANSLALVVFLLSFRPALVAGQTAGQSIAPVQAVPAKVLHAQAAGSVHATGSFQIIQGAQISPAIQLAPAA
ncbi:MAG: hypothetical protein ACK6DB_04010, partial [Planctomycetota bacterium]